MKFTKYELYWPCPSNNNFKLPPIPRPLLILILSHYCTQVYYIVPAFIVGLMVGVFLWALYILLYKTRTRYFPSTTTTTTASENDCTEMKRSNQNSFEDVSSQATVRSGVQSFTSLKADLRLEGFAFFRCIEGSSWPLSSFLLRSVMEQCLQGNSILLRHLPNEKTTTLFTYVLMEFYHQRCE